MAVKKCWAILHYDPKVVQSNALHYVIAVKDQGVRTFYLDENEAMLSANEIASKNPGELVIVLESKYIVEAKIPDTIAKAWKDNGELIPVDKVASRSKKAKAPEFLDDAIAQQLRPRRNEAGRERQPEVRIEYAFDRFGNAVHPVGGQGGQLPDPNQRDNALMGEDIILGRNRG